MKKQAVLPFTDPRGSSWLGRYLAQKAIRQQSRNDDPNVAVATIPTAAMMAVPPLAIPGYYANELVSNSVVQGNNPVEADRILSKTVKDLTNRTWKDQLLAGLKKSPSWALGGAVGSGLAGYLLSRLTGNGDPNRIALNSAIGGGLAGAAIPVATSAIDKLILDRMVTRHDKTRAKKYLASNSREASLPLGDVVGAAVT